MHLGHSGRLAPPLGRSGGPSHSAQAPPPVSPNPVMGPARRGAPPQPSPGPAPALAPPPFRRGAPPAWRAEFNHPLNKRAPRRGAPGRADVAGGGVGGAPGRPLNRRSQPARELEGPGAKQPRTQILPAPAPPVLGSAAGCTAQSMKQAGGPRASSPPDPRSTSSRGASMYPHPEEGGPSPAPPRSPHRLAPAPSELGSLPLPGAVVR